MEEGETGGSSRAALEEIDGDAYIYIYILKICD